MAAVSVRAPRYVNANSQPPTRPRRLPTNTLLTWDEETTKEHLKAACQEEPELVRIYAQFWYTTQHDPELVTHWLPQPIPILRHFAGLDFRVHVMNPTQIVSSWHDTWVYEIQVQNLDC
jgi:hypothetical protein